MENTEQILEELKKQGFKGDQMLLVALLTQFLTSQEMTQIHGPWKRICQRINEMEAVESRRTQVLKTLNEALQQIRLDMKYIVFDLEATRRERDELRERLKDLGLNDD